MRAIFAVVSNGNFTFYYDHWNAATFDLELLWGQSSFLKYLQQLPPIPFGNIHLSEVWTEGGAVIDFDKKSLLFYSAAEERQYNPLLRVHFMRVLSVLWEKWIIEWADEGAFSIKTALNISDSEFEFSNAPEPFHFISSFPEDNRVLLLSGDQPYQKKLCAGWVSAIELGPESFLSTYEKLPFMESQSVMDFEGVIHIEPKKKVLTVFWKSDTGSSRIKSEKAWAGWTVNWVFSNYGTFKSIVDFEIPNGRQSSQEAVSEIISEARRYLNDKRIENPAISISSNLGPNVVINPDTCFRRIPIGRLEKMKVLSQIEEGLVRAL